MLISIVFEPCCLLVMLQEGEDEGLWRPLGALVSNASLFYQCTSLGGGIHRMSSKEMREGIDLVLPRWAFSGLWETRSP